MTTKPTKDTIYLEADDEITAIIDHVISSKSKVVALVLPKRASVFQSVVNMKLLKKSADDAKKHLVLISSEEAIQSIAGVAGVYIARTLTSKPEIPSSPKRRLAETTIAADELEPTPTAPTESTAAATVTPVAEQESVAPEEDVISMDGADSGSDAPATATVADKQEKSKRAKRALKIPDFNSFRTKLAVGGLVGVILIGGWIYAFVIAPQALVTITVNTSKTTVSYQFTASAAAESLDTEKRVVPATVAEVTKEATAKVPATGKKDIGEKASGTMTLINCKKGDTEGMTIPSGSSFTVDGLSFVTQATVTLEPSVFAGNNCISGQFPGFGAVDDVAVIAANSGEQYNLSAKSYQSSFTGLTANGSAMTGGTTQVIQVVSAEDIQKATEQLKGGTVAEARSELKTQLEGDSLMVLDQTFEEGQPAVKNSPADGAEATEVTVTQTIVYKMLGVKSDDLKTILSAELAKQLNSQQNTKNVRDDGFSSAALRVINKVSANEQIIELQTIASLGENFDVGAMAEAAAGKSRGEIQKTFESREGVNSVDVSYSPAWVTTTPKKAEKIRVEIKEIEN